MSAGPLTSDFHRGCRKPTRYRLILFPEIIQSLHPSANKALLISATFEHRSGVERPPIPVSDRDVDLRDDLQQRQFQ